MPLDEPDTTDNVPATFMVYPLPGYPPAHAHAAVQIRRTSLSHDPQARLARAVEDALHRAERLNELELLAFGALAIDQRQPFDWPSVMPLLLASIGAASRSCSVVTVITRLALTCVIPRRAASASRSAMNLLKSTSSRT